jgi:SAM-dependent methyltransferase
VEHLWDDEAANWAAWARGSRRDAYRDYSPAFFELVPPAGRATLEVGCGEGRVCRDLAARGHRVVGVDLSPAMVDFAAEADPAGDYRVAHASDLPFADGRFDVVVAYNVLMDVDDLAGAVAEANRVLEPGGRLCACVSHPVNDIGSFAGPAPDARFVVDGSYLEAGRLEATEESDGVRMTFRSWTRPLEDYTRALEQAGLLIEALREPAMPHAAVERDPSRARWRRVPMFLFLRALKQRA